MKKPRLAITLFLLVLLFSLGVISVNAAVNGWNKSGTFYNYYKSGRMLTGWQKINGQLFYFKNSGGTGVKGRMYTGWIHDKNKTYYFKNSGGTGVKGRLYTGWIHDGKKTYYFKNSGGNGTKGLLYTGWIHNGDKTYYFKNSGGNGTKGLLYTGWIHDGDKTYYFKNSGGNGVKGLLYTGWITNSSTGRTYYFNKTGGNGVKGLLLTGWQTINDNMFYFQKDGSDGIKGTMLTGWQDIEGKTYYFYADGKMAVNTTIYDKEMGDEKELGDDGTVVHTWSIYNGGKTEIAIEPVHSGDYVDEDGKLITRYSYLKGGELIERAYYCDGTLVPDDVLIYPHSHFRGSLLSVNIFDRRLKEEVDPTLDGITEQTINISMRIDDMQKEGSIDLYSYNNATELVAAWKALEASNGGMSPKFSKVLDIWAEMMDAWPGHWESYLYGIYINQDGEREQSEMPGYKAGNWGILGIQVGVSEAFRPGRICFECGATK